MRFMIATHKIQLYTTKDNLLLDELNIFDNKIIIPWVHCKETYIKIFKADYINRILTEIKITDPNLFVKL